MPITIQIAKLCIFPRAKVLVSYIAPTNDCYLVIDSE